MDRAKLTYCSTRYVNILSMLPGFTTKNKPRQVDISGVEPKTTHTFVLLSSQLIPCVAT